MEGIEMNKVFLRVALAVFLVMTFSGNASATLFDGQTVNYRYLFPDINTPYRNADNGNKVVGPGIEASPVVDGYGRLP
jgi:hypothetical protein